MSMLLAIATFDGTIVTAPNTPDELAAAIRSALSKSVQGYIDAGRFLAQAKEAVGKGVVWERWLRDSVDSMSQSTASKLVAVAKYPPFQDHSNSNDLPVSLEALYELTHLPVEKFAQVKEHFISRNMTPADAKDLVGHRIQRIIEAKKAEEALAEQEDIEDLDEHLSSPASTGEILDFAQLFEGLEPDQLVEPDPPASVKKTAVAKKAAPPPPKPDPEYEARRLWAQEFRYALLEELPNEHDRDLLRALLSVADLGWDDFDLPASAERLIKLLGEKRPALRAAEYAYRRLRSRIADRLGEEHIEVSHE